MHRPTLQHPFLAAAAAALITLSACGGSDTPDDAASQAPAKTAAATPADDSAGGDGEPAAAGGGSNAQIEEFCTAVDEFVVAMNDMISDPLSVDVEALQATGQKLNESANTMADNIETDAERARFEECSANLAKVGT